jgi:hypothetical protein
LARFGWVASGLLVQAGELEYKKLSDRCGVWAESSVVDAAAYEFADTEEMLAAAEKVCGSVHGFLAQCHALSPPRPLSLSVFRLPKPTANLF